MAYLISILLYLGIITSPAEANQQIIDDNSELIQEIIIEDDMIIG